MLFHQGYVGIERKLRNTYFPHCRLQEMESPSLWNFPQIHRNHWPKKAEDETMQRRLLKLKKMNIPEMGLKWKKRCHVD